MIISAEIGRRKPNWILFDRYLQLTKTRANETLFVGDNIDDDIAGDKAIGMTATLLSDEKEKYNKGVEHVIQPNFIIPSVKELGQVITEIGRR